MTAAAIVEEIRPLGRESYKKVLLNYGVREPCFGVKIEKLKKIQRRIKRDHPLALDLYGTGIYDARYLAGLIADDREMTRRDLQRRVADADAVLAGSTVSWIAAGSPHGLDVALRWIESPKEIIASAGWATLISWVSIRDDAILDLAQLTGLLHRVERSIYDAPTAVRSKMNGFVIAAGSFVKQLSTFSVEVGERIGPVNVDMGNTACQVPFAPDSIRKVAQRGSIGKKGKSAKC